MHFWGYGRPGYNPNISVNDVVESFFKDEKPDFAVFGLYFLCIPPSDAKELECPKVTFIEDNYIQCSRPISDWVQRYGINCLWHRYFTGFTKILSAIKNKTGKEPYTIDVPWAINPQVFCPSKNQSFDVSLMGNYSRRYYPTRYKIFIEIERDPELKVVRRPHPSAFRPRGHRRKQVPGSVIGNAYAEALASAKIGITTGGEVGYPVARHFEILACGSVLVCHDRWEIRKKGFEPDVHFIEIDEKNPVEQVKELLNNNWLRMNLSGNGRRLILEKHTWDKRVEDTTNAMESLGIIG